MGEARSGHGADEGAPAVGVTSACGLVKISRSATAIDLDGRNALGCKTGPVRSRLGSVGMGICVHIMLRR